MLSDLGSTYAEVCGVRFDMSEGGITLYARLAARFGQTIAGLDPAAGWELPIPATYVTGTDGVIRYTFGDADWSKRAEPADMVAAIERIA